MATSSSYIVFRKQLKQLAATVSFSSATFGCVSPRRLFISTPSHSSSCPSSSTNSRRSCCTTCATDVSSRHSSSSSGNSRRNCYAEGSRFKWRCAKIIVNGICSHKTDSSSSSCSDAWSSTTVNSSSNSSDCARRAFRRTSFQRTVTASGNPVRLCLSPTYNSSNLNSDISLSKNSTWNNNFCCDVCCSSSSLGDGSSLGSIMSKRWKRYIPFRSSRVPKTRQPPPAPPPLFSASSAADLEAALQPAALQFAVAASAEENAEEEAATAEAALQLSPWQAVRVLQAFLPPAPRLMSPSAAAAVAGSLFPAAAAVATQAAVDKETARTGGGEQREGREHMRYQTFFSFEQQQQRDGETTTAAAVAVDETSGEAAAAEGDEAAAADQSAERTADTTVRLTLNVAADLKRESVRGVCTLAHGVGSNVRLAVFCPDEEAPAMLALGADYAGVDALLPRIAKGWVGFDKALAVASVMPQLLKVARVLGPRKLMPSPKSGTVVANLKEAVKAVKSGEAVEFRAEGENAEIQVLIGRTSFEASQLLENIKCVVKDILRARPRSTGTEQDDAAQAAAQAFVWPPPSFVERRQKLLAAKNLLPAIPELGAASSRQRQRSSAESFITAAHLSAAGTPSIPVQPLLLAPSSVGYYR